MDAWTLVSLISPNLANVVVIMKGAFAVKKLLSFTYSAFRFEDTQA